MTLDTSSVTAMRTRMAQLATKALLYEISVTPKPGLVDRNNTGSHHDMDFFLFIDSAIALSPFWSLFYDLGTRFAVPQPDLKALFQSARMLGRDADLCMFQATKNINTHKGMIFNLGLLCLVCGHLFLPVSTAEFLSKAGAIAQYALEDFSTKDSSTTGLSLYRRHAIGGIRTEAAAGFPSVAGVSLPVLKQCLTKGATLNDAAVCTILHLLASVEDTTMIKRSSVDDAAILRRQIAEFLSARPTQEEILQEAARLDSFFVQNRLSAGGCADLLSITLFVWFLQQEGMLS